MNEFNSTNIIDVMQTITKEWLKINEPIKSKNHRITDSQKSLKK